MDLITCSITTETGGVPASISKQLCRRVAEVLKAKPVSGNELETAISNAAGTGAIAHFHVLEASIISTHAISFKYAFGTADAWRESLEKRYEDLQIDMSDAVINEAALSILADTVRRLSE